MENGEKTKTEQDQRQRKGGSVLKKKIAKFTGTLDMDAALDRMVQMTNEGYSGGRVTKHDLVSWAVLYFEKQCFSGCIDKIRQDHFDQVVHLELLLRQAKQARRAGADATEVAAILSSATTASRSTPHRRPRRSESPDTTL